MELSASRTGLRKVLVTGVNGFIGQHLCQRLLADGIAVRGTVRTLENGGAQLDLLNKTKQKKGVSLELVQTGDIERRTDWSEFMLEVDAVVHLAARVHVNDDHEPDSMDAFLRVNTYGTEVLAKAATQSETRRFVHISSVKVNGEGTSGRDRRVYSEKDSPSPEDPYARSKWQAEVILNKIAEKKGLEIVILRPPLVYGPGVKANFRRLLKLIKVGVPLPLKSVNNQRSMIYVGNLVDSIVTCLVHPHAAQETFLVSDDEDISTTRLINMIAAAMGQKSRLLPFPTTLLQMLAKLIGKSREVKRLQGSLRVDCSKIKKMLKWSPPFPMQEGIQETVNWFLNTV